MIRFADWNNAPEPTPLPGNAANQRFPETMNQPASHDDLPNRIIKTGR